MKYETPVVSVEKFDVDQTIMIPLASEPFEF